MTALMTEDREYLRLTKRLPPRPIHTRTQYEQTLLVVNELATRDEDNLTPAEADYLDALAMFVARYEAAHVPEPPPGTALDRLRYVVESAGMTASDLGRLLCHRGLGSALLSGKRALSKNHIRILAHHFKLDAAYFL